MNNAWIYKTKDIDGIYQSMIMKYVAKGYKIITAHMGGSQGEKSKIDFTDGKDIYRIWYYEDSENLDTKYYMHSSILCISVHKYEIDKKELYNYDYTLWRSKGEIIEEKVFYLINEYDRYGRTWADRKAYVTDKEVAKELINKAYNRYDPTEVYYKIALSKDSKKRIIEIIKAHHSRGYSTLKIKDIDYLERIYDTHYKNGRNQYRVIFSKDYKEHDMYLKSLH